MRPGAAKFVRSVTLAAFSIILSNASDVEPVSDLHQLCASLHPTARQQLLVQLGGGTAASGDDFLQAPALQRLCVRGTGLFSVMNTANHSCVPSAVVASSATDHTLSLYAGRPLRADDELSISCALLLVFSVDI